LRLPENDLSINQKSQPYGRILASLSQEDRDLLSPDLQLVELPLRKELERRNKRIDYVYFFNSGIASVVATDGPHGSVEVGIIGREGMSGLAVLMWADRSPHETFMQMAGSGHRQTASSLRKAMLKSSSLNQFLLRYAYAFTIQTAQTALVNGRFKLEERLSRWLLMSHDRVDGDYLTVTHRFLALMLGVRRAGVSVALASLENDALIQVKRGGVLVVDRVGLEECANGAYGLPEAELIRLTS
jgi:CRP-like cAMP-binding protein